ncbi:MAG: hypothetical protein H6766_07185 [Candidatus Peribacteria bacterium]|nr:MAG: hypothetical protein H6766_07185 [Candidatus Peribacteria bacterium]
MGNNHDSMGKSDFGALAHGAMYRSLASRTWTIPVAGQGNVPYALRGYDSEDFLTLGYNNLMVYTLDLDQTTDASNYYND